MEDIYTIKVRTHPDPSNLYPSERRYSASTVLGLGVVHIALGITAFLLASLTLVARNDQLKHDNHTILTTKKNIESIPTPLTLHDIQNPETARKIEMFSMADFYLKQKSDTLTNSSEVNEVHIDKQHIDQWQDKMLKNDVQIPNLTLASCLIALAALVAGFVGILAWRRWYIDQNIVWFFVTSLISTLVTFACLCLILVSLARMADFHLQDYYASNPRHYVLHTENGIVVLRSETSVQTESNGSYIDNIDRFFHRKNSSLRTVLAINIIIATILEFIWSILSVKIAWRGMRSDYPDDVNAYRGRGRNFEVSTVYKGNSANRKKITPTPDIIAHYPTKGKIAKYFPKREVVGDYLPKAESNKEYQERVNRFLTSNTAEDVEK